MSTYEVRFEASNRISASNKKQREEAKEIIEHSLPTFIDKHSRSGTLKKTKLVRLDLQGQINNSNANGIRYANLQIQLNSTTAFDGPTDESEEDGGDVDCTDGGGPKRTTIANALMPIGEQIPENIMKKAFNGSLDAGKKATIFKTC